MVLKEITKIQRDFLWEGSDKNRKVNWIKWSIIFNLKKKGGLRLKDSRRFNLALLSKWN